MNLLCKMCDKRLSGTAKGGELCTNCWEVTRRLVKFIQDGKEVARGFIERCLEVK